jgi:hypothetical protein
LSRIRYCVPSERAGRRLLAYGVPRGHIHLTGFPLPPELVGGGDLAVLRANLARRLPRLDPDGVFRDQYRPELEHFSVPMQAQVEATPPTLTFAVGGAGAQTAMVRPMLASLQALLRDGRLRLALVAGTRRDLASLFDDWCRKAGLGDLLGGAVEILQGADFHSYYRSFNELLGRTDILWTKPSELTFYGALGLPLLFSPPVGVHERLNRRWAIQRGVGIKQENPRYVGQWLPEMLAEGTLAAAAWSGYVRMPKFGTSRILEVVRAVAAS